LVRPGPACEKNLGDEMRLVRMQMEALVAVLLAAATTVVGSDVDGDGVDDTLDTCCNTPVGVAVDSSGRPIGDLDRDCDVDLNDLALIFQNVTGPLLPPDIGEPCDDNDPCTVDDHIECGVCVGEPTACDDGLDCTADFCDPGGPPGQSCTHLALCIDATPVCRDGELTTFTANCSDTGCGQSEQVMSCPTSEVDCAGLTEISYSPCCYRQDACDPSGCQNQKACTSRADECIGEVYFDYVATCTPGVGCGNPVAEQIDCNNQLAWSCRLGRGGFEAAPISYICDPTGGCVRGNTGEYDLCPTGASVCPDGNGTDTIIEHLAACDSVDGCGEVVTSSICNSRVKGTVCCDSLAGGDAECVAVCN